LGDFPARFGRKGRGLARLPFSDRLRGSPVRRAAKRGASVSKRPRPVPASVSKCRRDRPESVSASHVGVSLGIPFWADRAVDLGLLRTNSSGPRRGRSPEIARTRWPSRRLRRRRPSWSARRGAFRPSSVQRHARHRAPPARRAGARRRAPAGTGRGREPQPDQPRTPGSACGRPWLSAPRSAEPGVETSCSLGIGWRRNAPRDRPGRWHAPATRGGAALHDWPYGGLLAPERRSKWAGVAVAVLAPLGPVPERTHATRHAGFSRHHLRDTHPAIRTSQTIV